MLKIQQSYSSRPVVARDGSVYFIRQLHKVSRSIGIYIPKQLLKALGWDHKDALMMWTQGDVLCIQRIELAPGRTRLIPVPPRGERPDKVGSDEEI